MTNVSIILPTYNRGDTLARAVDSVVAQTYSDWELLIVDDGSTDETASVALSYNDPRIRYIRQENAGVAAARNTGLDRACGQYITFLDSDDEWLPHFLAVCVGFLQNNPTEDFVTTEFFTGYLDRRDNRGVFVDTYLAAARAIGSHALDLPPDETDDYLRVYETCRKLDGWTYDVTSKEIAESGLLYQGHVFEYTRWGYLGWLPTTMITRHALEVVGKFDATMRHASDYRFLALLAKEFRTNFISIPCARKHEQGLDDANLREDHLARGAGGYNFRVNRLKSFDALHFDDAAAATDAELQRIRKHYVYHTGIIAFEDGLRLEALSHFRYAKSWHRHFWPAHLLWIAALLLPGKVAWFVCRVLAKIGRETQKLIGNFSHAQVHHLPSNAQSSRQAET